MNGAEFQIQVQGGRKTVKSNFGERFIETNYHNFLLSEIIQSYAVGDLCLIGPRGSGKSMLITQIAKLLKQNIEPMVLYQDMTARDFVQQRTTTAIGDTVWRDSPLIRAAKIGSIAILDGIHRIHSSTVSVLHRLVHDREIQLYDGSRLIDSKKYDELIAAGHKRDELTKNGIIRIHPGFRMVALAEPPIIDAGKNWLSPEVLSLFMFHEVRNMSKEEEKLIILSLVSILLSCCSLKTWNKHISINLYTVRQSESFNGKNSKLGRFTSKISRSNCTKFIINLIN